MTPTELTLHFISDYKKWNDFAFQNAKEGVLIEEKYKNDLISYYCLPNKKYQNIAFSNESSHCPLKEKIIFQDIKSKAAIIRTLYKDPKLDFIQNIYEYHFDKIKNVWYLIEVYLVDKNGKYEGL